MLAPLLTRFAPPAQARPGARPAPARRRARRALAWGAALFAAANLTVGLTAEWYVRARDPLYGDKAVKLSRRTAERPGSPLVLVLGSSRTGLGFHALRAESALESHGIRATAFNFGVPAAGPVTQRLTFDRAAASGALPAVAVIEVMPAMLADDPAGPIERQWLYADRVTYSETETLTRYGFAPGPVARRHAASVLLPAYTLRFQLMCRVIPSWLPWPVRFDWSRGADAGGWGTTASQQVAGGQRDAGVARARSEYEPTLGGLRPGGHAVAALRDLLAECRARGVTARLVLMPEGSPFAAWYGPGANERLLGALRPLAAEYAAPLTDARGWLPDSAFYDGHHMLRAGAEAFTDRLTAEVIAPALRERGAAK